MKTQLSQLARTHSHISLLSVCPRRRRRLAVLGYQRNRTEQKLSMIFLLPWSSERRPLTLTTGCFVVQTVKSGIIEAEIS